MIVNVSPGALVRDPVTKLALADGAAVDEHDPYIGRALLDGDLVAAPAKAPRSGRHTSTQVEDRD